MKRLSFSLLMAFLTWSFLACAPARPSAAKWIRLGERTVNMQIDHDEIMVTAAEGVFTKVKFHILKAPIHVLTARVVFGNGKDIVLGLNKRYAAGQWTKVFDLPGNKRIIRKIVVNYKSVPVGKGRAHIVAWGKH